MFVSDRVNHALPSTTVHNLGILIDSNVASRVSVTYGVGMFCCYDNSAASDVQCPTLVFHSLVVSLVATSRLRRRNTRRASRGPAPSTSVGAQRRRRTDRPRSSQYEHVTPMPRDLHWLRSSISSWLYSSTDACMVWRHGIFLTTSSASYFPTAAVSGRRHILAACPNTAVHCRRSCVSGSWKPTLEQSAAS